GAPLRDARRVSQKQRQARDGVALRLARRGKVNMLDRTPPEKNPLAMAPADRMPREIASGVFWIGDCLLQRHKGKIYHGYNAAFLVAGDQERGVVAVIDL